MIDENSLSKLGELSKIISESRDLTERFLNFSSDDGLPSVEAPEDILEKLKLIQNQKLKEQWNLGIEMSKNRHSESDLLKFADDLSKSLVQNSYNPKFHLNKVLMTFEGHPMEIFIEADSQAFAVVYKDKACKEIDKITPIITETQFAGVIRLIQLFESNSKLMNESTSSMQPLLQKLISIADENKPNWNRVNYPKSKSLIDSEQPFVSPSLLRERGASALKLIMGDTNIRSGEELEELFAKLSKRASIGSQDPPSSVSPELRAFLDQNKEKIKEIYEKIGIPYTDDIRFEDVMTKIMSSKDEATLQEQFMQLSPVAALFFEDATPIEGISALSRRLENVEVSEPDIVEESSRLQLLIVAFGRGDTSELIDLLQNSTMEDRESFWDFLENQDDVWVVNHGLILMELAVSGHLGIGEERAREISALLISDLLEGLSEEIAAEELGNIGDELVHNIRTVDRDIEGYTPEKLINEGELGRELAEKVYEMNKLEIDQIIQEYDGTEVSQNRLLQAILPGFIDTLSDSGWGK
jgi:hypothetical protein